MITEDLPSVAGLFDSRVFATKIISEKTILIQGRYEYNRRSVWLAEK